jgi:hypothetical protein
MIVWIIALMCRKIVAALVILGWISLSGFDVLEDLNEFPSDAAVSKSLPDNSPIAKRGFSVHLANNMVELAYRNQQVDIALYSFAPTVLDFAPVLHFRRHSPLHKLFRVLLI